MPVIVWSGIASIIGMITGMIYEKESNKKVVEDVASVAGTSENNSKQNCYSKLIMAAAGVAAYWIYRSTK